MRAIWRAAMGSAWVRRLLLWVGCSAAAAPVIFMATCTGLQLAAPRLAKQAVSDPHAERFPVLVVTGEADRYRAQIVFANEMDAFLGGHPDARFTVPAGWEKRLGQQLADAAAAERKEHSSDGPWDPSFEVEPLGVGRQRLHVVDTYDEGDVNESWYTAEEKRFTPEYHKQLSSIGVGIGSGFLAGPLALWASPVAGLAAVAWLEWRRKKRGAGAKPAA